MIELVIVSRLLEYRMLRWRSISRNSLMRSRPLKTDKDAQTLGVFLRDLLARDLLDAQADYSQLFDRGRATSLLLFEHVHGESRDRGQAMVDLMAQYEQHGLQLDSRELPDHLPLCTVSGAVAKEALGGLRTSRRFWRCSAPVFSSASRYAALFGVLVKLANASVDSEKVAEKLRTKPATTRHRRWMQSGKKSR